MSDITVERLREVLDYDQETGVFAWKISTSNSVKIGDVAGSINGDGYRKIKLDGREYQAHRLAWIYVTGEWPKEFIDHINSTRLDNRFSNLREATHAENRRNVGKQTNNSSGFKGVCWHNQTQRWQAQIAVNGRNKYLGLFDTPEAAHAAYRVAAEKLHGEFSRSQ